MEEDDIFDYGEEDKGETPEKVRIGVVGTSRRGLVDKQCAKEIVCQTLDEIARLHTGKKLVICSGGGLVPTLGFDWANQKHVESIQVVSAAVRGYHKYVSERIEIGSSHGDESEHFVGMIDVMVRIGGGPQSRAEVARFRKENPGNLIVEKELPLLPDAAPLRKTNQKCKQYRR